jgi:nicotinamide N-methyltransferase
MDDDPTRTPQALVFYTHHRPHLADRDMEFFDKARTRGWSCVEVLKETYEVCAASGCVQRLTRCVQPMFPDDPGAADVRAMVHGWRLTRNRA